MKKTKTAIVLMNLGGPSNISEVKQFLFNLFYDKAIIRLPNPLRWIIAKIISSKREKPAKEIYEKMGGKSPILEETKKQKDELEKKFDSNTRFYISMRYSSPRSFEISKAIKEFNPDKIILLPLYPQFSSTTSASSIDDMMKELRLLELDKIATPICCYFDDEDFIKSHLEKLKIAIKNLKSKNYRILFSAHGLPENVIKNGDPYQWQVEKTVEKIVSKLGIKNLDYKITYQSRVGPMKWIEPYTDKVIEETCKEKKAIIIVPIAFVSEHSETLVELDIEYADIAKSYQIEYVRVEALRSDKFFIESLEKIIKNHIKQNNSVTSFRKSTRICPENFTNCICK